MDGVEGEFEAVGDAELVENVVQVVLHRLLADEKLLADLAVVEALRHELNELALRIPAEPRYG